jgi:integrase/recombinase XerC
MKHSVYTLRMTQLPLITIIPETNELHSPQDTEYSPSIKPDPLFLLKIFLSKGSEQTQRGHQNDLIDFATFLKAQSRIEAVIFLLGRDQAELNALAYAYRQHQIARKLAPATTNRRLSTLRSLLKLAKMLGLCTNSIEIENLAIEPYRDTRGPGQEGVTKLLQALAERKDAKGARDRAMIRLMYDLALRRAEVVSLDLSHIDPIEGIVWVLGKGRNSRQKLSLAPETNAALTHWIAFRGEQPGPLFVNLDNSHARGRLSDSGLYRVVRYLGEKVGLKTRPHGLRHAAITFALDVTKGDVRAVQRFSRHKSLNVLLIYDDQRKDLAGEVSKLVAKSV